MLLFHSINCSCKVCFDISLPHSNHASLKIYDLTGCEIASLIDKHLEQKTHRIIWDAKNVAPGYYMAKLQAGTNICVKSITVF